MQKLIQLAVVVSLGVIAAALLNSRSKSEIGVSPLAVPQPWAQVQPYQKSVSCTLLDDSNNASVVFTAPSTPLVIQTVSMYRSLPTSGTWAQVLIRTVVNGEPGVFALPYIGDTTISPLPGVTLAAVFYADPGSTVEVLCYRTGTSGIESDSITVSGYLMSDLPLARSGTVQPPAGPLPPATAGLVPPSSGLPMFTRVPAQ